MTPLVTMRAALGDPDLFGKVLVGASWDAWRVLLIAIMGEPLTDDERVVFASLTGRERGPLERPDEAWLIMGRRSGKTRSAAVLAAYIAALCDHAYNLAPGERGILPIMSASTWQASKAFAFVSGIFAQVPTLAALVEKETADTVSLSTGVDTECRPASFRTVRGSTFIAVIADEVAFWRSDETSRNPDAAILAAARPSLATTGGALLVISSPYAQAGELYRAFKRDYGPDGDPSILVAKAASRTMNQTLSQKVVDRAYERDPQTAAAEFGGEFRSDLEQFISRDLIQSAVDVGVLVRPPRAGLRYVGFVDAASGVGKDSYAACVAHAEGVEVVVDLIHEIRPPFNPTQATAEVCALLKSYRINSVRGDKYSAGFVIEAHAKCGVSYTYSDNDTSQNYLESLPLFTSGRVRLVDNPRVVAQFAGLERRTGTGRDRVDHGAGDRHDDASAATAGALAVAAAGGRVMIISPEALRNARQIPRGGRYADRARRMNIRI